MARRLENSEQVQAWKQVRNASLRLIVFRLSHRVDLKSATLSMLALMVSPSM